MRFRKQSRPEEMPHYAEFHWGAHCLPKDSFSEESVVYKGFKITSNCGTASKYRVKLNFLVNKGLSIDRRRFCFSVNG